MECCTGVGNPQQAEVLAGLASDPTLQDCCRRDFLEQARAAKLRSQLAAVDRSTQRQKLASKVISSEPPELAAEAGGGSDSDDDNAEVRALRDLRMRELQHQAQLRTKLEASGHGQLVDVPADKLLDEVQTTDGWIACHLDLGGSEVGQALDEHLTTLAHRHPSVRFLHVAVSRGSRLLQQMALDFPEGLVCFKAGRVLGAAAVQLFMEGSSELHEEAINRWLRKLKVFPADKTHLQTWTNEEERTDGSEGEEDEWREPCEICGRRFFHEHIKSVYSTKLPGNNEDSD